MLSGKLNKADKKFYRDQLMKAQDLLSANTEILKQRGEERLFLLRQGNCHSVGRIPCWFSPSSRAHHRSQDLCSRFAFEQHYCLVVTYAAESSVCSVLLLLD